ncbi:MAG: hypothetical protein KAX23_02095 [Dehalococcoidia bacterium]|nr:hypothetical protein [Dehalococcoidia bacterium]
MGSEGFTQKGGKKLDTEGRGGYNSKAGSRALAFKQFTNSRAKMPAFADDRQIAEMINPSFIAALTLAKEVLTELGDVR